MFSKPDTFNAEEYDNYIKRNPFFSKQQFIEGLSKAVAYMVYIENFEPENYLENSSKNIKRMLETFLNVSDAYDFARKYYEVAHYPRLRNQLNKEILKKYDEDTLTRIKQLCAGFSPFTHDESISKEDKETIFLYIIDGDDVCEECEKYSKKHKGRSNKTLRITKEFQFYK